MGSERGEGESRLREEEDGRVGELLRCFIDYRTYVIGIGMEITARDGAFFENVGTGKYVFFPARTLWVSKCMSSII